MPRLKLELRTLMRAKNGFDNFGAVSIDPTSRVASLFA